MGWSEIAERKGGSWRAEESLSAEQHHHVCQQAHDPGELQGVEEELVQAELVLFVGLSGLHPRAHAGVKMPGQPGVVRHLAEEDFVTGCWISKLARTVRLFPAPSAEIAWPRGREPLLLCLAIIVQPLQGLALMTARRTFAGVRVEQLHAGFQAGDEGHTQLFAQAALGGQVDVGQIADDPLRQPTQTTLAFAQAGVKEKGFAAIGWNGPGAQRHQKLGRLVVGQPQAKSMLLIPNEIAGAAGLDGAPAQRGLAG